MGSLTPVPVAVTKTASRVPGSHHMWKSRGEPGWDWLLPLGQPHYLWAFHLSVMEAEHGGSVFYKSVDV